MREKFWNSELLSTEEVPVCPADTGAGLGQSSEMANQDNESPGPSAPPVRWYLHEWMKVRGKKQVHMQTEMGWSKTRSNSVFNNKQHITLEILGEVGDWLDVDPPELLMHPTTAMAMQRMRQSVEALVNDQAAVLGEDPQRGPAPSKRGRQA